MRRITRKTARNTIEWLLLIALAALFCFASCKKEPKESDSGDGTTVSVDADIEVGGDTASTEGSETTGEAEGENAEDESSAEAETPADGESTEGEGNAEDDADNGADPDADKDAEGGAEQDGDGAEGEAGSEGSDAAPPVEASIDPQKVYIDNGCGMCHKVDRSGGTLGPDIRNIAEFWTPENLTGYLKNPAGTLDRYPRLVEMEKEGKYLAEMPPLREQDESRIKALVDWLMTPAE